VNKFQAFSQSVSHLTIVSSNYLLGYLFQERSRSRTRTFDRAYCPTRRGANL